MVRYDRRGHGRSDAPTGRYSPVRDLGALLEHLGIERAALIGASAGGRLALDYAVAFPERVSALVLVGAVVTGYGYSDHFLERGRAHMAPLADGDVDAAVSAWAEDRYLIAPGNDEARARLRRLLEAHAETRFLQQDPGLASVPGPPALGRLGGIAVPTLIVVGAEDIPDVHAHAGAIDSRLEDSERVVVPGAGHLVPLERPEEFHRLVLAFLSRGGSR